MINVMKCLIFRQISIDVCTTIEQVYGEFIYKAAGKQSGGAQGWWPFWSVEEEGACIELTITASSFTWIICVEYQTQKCGICKAFHISSMVNLQGESLKNSYKSTE